MENVKSRVIELMQKHFSWLSDDEDTPVGVTNKITSQCETFDALGISRDELDGFVDVLIKEFDLKDLTHPQVRSWQRIRDIVRYIRNVNCIDVEIYKKELPCINGFELEA